MTNHGATSVFGSERYRVSLFIKALTFSFSTRSWPLWVKYAATFLITLAVLGLRIAVQPWIPAFPLLFFFVSVIISAVIFDHGSGLVAAVLGSLASFYVSYHSGMLEDHWTGLALGFFVLMLVAMLIEALQETAHQHKRTADNLRRAEADKDVLIRENAHRVRNDLTIFSSMIRLQQTRITDPEAREAFQALNDRLLVLMRVHQRLRMGTGETSVDSRDFLNDLGEELSTSLSAQRGINLVINAESHLLNHRAAVALGIIVNELLTNAIKYAFIGRDRGEVVVEFVRDDDRWFVLTVQDDGVGNDGTVRGTGLGTKLIQAMARQLEGSIAFGKSRKGGFSSTLRFIASDASSSAKRI